MQLALYQPDIAQNVGTLLRLSACMETPIHIIEPCGFPWDERKVRRSAMDYINKVTLKRHASWEKFKQQYNGRIILLTTKTNSTYTDFAYQADDILLLGRESAGVPQAIHDQSDAQITIPMAPSMRSLNVAVAGAMVLGEALRQTSLFP